MTYTEFSMRTSGDTIQRSIKIEDDPVLFEAGGFKEVFVKDKKTSLKIKGRHFKIF